MLSSFIRLLRRLQLKLWKLGCELENLHFGVEKLVAEISLEVFREQGIDRTLCHGDTTSFSFSGKYAEQEDAAVQTRIDTPMIPGFSSRLYPFGHKSPVVRLVSRQQLELQRLKKLKEAFTQGDWPEMISITDSKGCSLRNQVWFEYLSFVTRVQATFSAHDERVKLAIARDDSWTALEEDEKAFWQEFEHASERWIVVYSQAGVDRSRCNLDKALPKEKETLEKKLAELKRKSSGCEVDARKACQEVLSKAKYHTYTDLKVEANVKQKGCGRPEANSKKVVDHWRIVGAQIEEDTQKTLMLDVEGGCYIAATNVPAERMTIGKDSDGTGHRWSESANFLFKTCGLGIFVIF